MFRQCILIFLALSSFFLVANVSAKVASFDKQLQDKVIENKKTELTLLEKLVNINSGTTNLSGIHQVGNIVRQELNQLGFTTQWIELPPDMHRAGMLLAERHGNQGHRVLLIGHLDTVFPPDSQFQKFELRGTTATGPGITDDKGGIATILYALKALNQLHSLDNTNITVVLMGDEEDSGKPTSISRKALINLATQNDIALDFEWALANNTATIARRGISHWTIEAQGKEGHSSDIFQKGTGDGAIFELSRILNTMRTNLSGEKYLSFSPGIILGGTTITEDKSTSTGSASGKFNVIAQAAMARGDLRFLTPEQETSARNKILDIIGQHLPGTTASIIFKEGIPGMAPTLGNQELLKKYSQASMDLGFGPVTAVDPNQRGAADISHIASQVKANLAGLGPVGTGTHSANETLDVASLSMNTQRAALLISRLTH